MQKEELVLFLLFLLLFKPIKSHSRYLFGCNGIVDVTGKRGELIALKTSLVIGAWSEKYVANDTGGCISKLTKELCHSGNAFFDARSGVSNAVLEGIGPSEHRGY